MDEHVLEELLAALEDLVAVLIFAEEQFLLLDGVLVLTEQVNLERGGRWHCL